MKMIRKAAALILIVTILTGCDAWKEDRKIIVDYRYTSEHYEKETEYKKEYSWMATRRGAGRTARDSNTTTLAQS